MRLLIFLSISWLAILAFDCNASKPVIKDLRILIDVSGSMAENDPGNLRAAALKMLARILPAGLESGVWVFESATHPIIPPAKVDDNWIAMADATVEDIHAEGQYTNIAEALEVAILGWTNITGERDKHIIILTDGLVDISDNKWENDESRAHILHTLLPKLKKQSITVHSIALSKDADQDLLQQLSVNTQGMYSLIEYAKDLQRVFVKIFEKTVKPNTVPIEENKFKIDKKINEVTLLVFRLKDPIRLKTPKGKIYHRKELPENVKWYEAGLVDLITIKKPLVGDWAILGSIDKDNMAVIISDLELKISEIPAGVFVGESIYLQAELMEKEKRITNPKLLELMEVSTELNPGTEYAQLYSLKDDGKLKDKSSQDGIYSVQIGPLKNMGGIDKLELRTSLKGKTFARQKQQIVNLLPEPIKIITNSDVDDKNNAVLTVDLVPDWKVLKLGSFKAQAKIVDNQGRIISTAVAFKNQDLWQLQLVPNADVISYNIQFIITAETVTGRKVTINMEPMVFMVPKIVVVEPEPAPIVNVEENITKTLPNGVTEDSKLLEEQKIEKELEISWLMVLLIAILFVMINLLLGLGMYYLLKVIKRRRGQDVNAITGKLKD